MFLQKLYDAAVKCCAGADQHGWSFTSSQGSPTKASPPNTSTRYSYSKAKTQSSAPKYYSRYSSSPKNSGSTRRYEEKH